MLSGILFFVVILSKIAHKNIEDKKKMLPLQAIFSLAVSLNYLYKIQIRFYEESIVP